MAEVTVVKNLAASADKIWTVLADFAGFLNWAGAGEIRIEGEGVGMIRHLNMGVGEIAERLDVLDHNEKIIGYSLVYGEPIGMKIYRARVQVLPADSDSCEIHWHGEFEPAQAGAEEETAQLLKGAFGGMSDALVAYCGKT